MPLKLLVVAVALAACSANDDVPAPIVAAVTPDQGQPGAIVTVTGSYFCQRPEGTTDDPNCDVAGTVHFGAVPATPSTWSDTAIMVEVPEGISGEEAVQVTADGRTSNTVGFTAD
ncbi:MAG TPA: IPT/TIG domain-containing protein [Kofleriaceae bacterium]|nr:IPT/TIG domain-containing protein [Kofleriaceae bacterium]